MSEEILRIGVHELTTIRVRQNNSSVVEESPIGVVAKESPQRLGDHMTPQVAVAVLCEAIEVLSKKGAPHVEFSIVTRQDNNPPAK